MCQLCWRPTKQNINPTTTLKGPFQPQTSEESATSSHPRNKTQNTACSAARQLRYQPFIFRFLPSTGTPHPLFSRRSITLRLTSIWPSGKIKLKTAWWFGYLLAPTRGVRPRVCLTGPQLFSNICTLHDATKLQKMATGEAPLCFNVSKCKDVLTSGKFSPALSFGRRRELGNISHGKSCRTYISLAQIRPGLPSRNNFENSSMLLFEEKTAKNRLNVSQQFHY